MINGKLLGPHKLKGVEKSVKKRGNRFDEWPILTACDREAWALWGQSDESVHRVVMLKPSLFHIAYVSVLRYIIKKTPQSSPPSHDTVSHHKACCVVNLTLFYCYSVAL